MAEDKGKFPKSDHLRAMRERSYEARKKRNPAEKPEDEDKALARGRARLAAARRAINKVTAKKRSAE